MGPVGVFSLVQFGLWEGGVEVLDGHLIEGDHVLKFSQLKAHITEPQEREKTGMDLNANTIKMFVRYFRN